MKKLYVAPDADIVRFVAEERMAALDEASIVGGAVDFDNWDGMWN